MGIAAWDANLVAPHKRMGNTGLSLESLCDGNLHEVLVELEGMGGGGKLQLEVRFKSFDEIEEEKKWWRLPFILDFLKKNGLESAIKTVVSSEAVPARQFVEYAFGQLKSFNDFKLSKGQITNSGNENKDAEKSNAAYMLDMTPQMENRSESSSNDTSSNEESNKDEKQVGETTESGKHFWRNFADVISQNVVQKLGVPVPEKLKWDSFDLLNKVGLQSRQIAEASYIQSGLAKPDVKENENDDDKESVSATMIPFQASLPHIKKATTDLLRQTDSVLGALMVLTAAVSQSNKEAGPKREYETDEESLTKGGNLDSQNIRNELLPSIKEGTASGEKEAEEMKALFSTAESAIFQRVLSGEAKSGCTVMDGKKKAFKAGEISMLEKKAVNGSEVSVTISSEETPKDSKGSSSQATIPSSSISNGLPPKSIPISCPSPENSRFCPSPNKPPKVPTTADATLTRRKTLARSVYSKPKSRFGEQPFEAIDSDALEENEAHITAASPTSSFSRASPYNKSFSSMRADSITQKTPSMASHGGPREDEDEEIYKKVTLSKENRKGVKTKVLIEWLVLVCLVGCLIASLTVEKLVKYTIWGLEVWKWCVLVLVTFSGMFLTNYMMHIIVFLIEKNFLLRKKVLYFVHGLKKSVQVFVWLALVLLSWVLLINRGVERSKTASKILDCITWTLLSCQIGAFLWLVKTLLLKILASNFHVNKFFDRVQESVFHQYVLQTLSGPPLVEEREKFGISPSTGELSLSSVKKGKEVKAKQVIDMGKIHRMKQEKVSAWTMKVLVDAIRTTGLSTLSNTLDESVNDQGNEQTDKEITNEMEAIAAAYHIFSNVAKPGCKYIEEEDLLRFMIKEEVDLVFPLIEGSETGRIDRKSLINWVVKVYQGRKALGHALNDTKTAVKQLNNLVTVILAVVTVIIWLLLMEIATTKVLLFLSSQLVVAAFIFGNTCKTIFEAIIFVFVMHPFDVGDRCCIDGVPLLVEEMNILTTVFLKLDNEKVYYPNSVLTTKPISNYYRSPDMGDTVEFSIDFMTPLERIGMLKDRIKKYLENNPQHWRPIHTVVVKEIENVNKIKMALYCNHTMNFQEWGEKNKRRSELVTEMKRMFDDLNIKYNLLPQQVHLGYVQEP